MSVSVVATHGNLSFALASRYTLHYSTGSGSDDKTIAVVGALDDINQALATLSYTGDMDWYGTDKIVVSADDRDGETHSASISVTVQPVNDAPRIDIPLAANGLIVAEDHVATVQGITVADVDLADGGSLLLTLSAAHGTLSLSSKANLKVHPTVNGGGSIAVEGGLAALQHALLVVTYKPAADWNGIDAIVVSARDAADSGEQIQTTVTTFDVTVTAVNDAPVISHQRSTPFVMAEGTTLRIQPLSVTDVDVGESWDATLTVALSAKHGTLSLGVPKPSLHLVHFLAGTGNGDTNMTVVGTVVNLNALLSAVDFTPRADWNGNTSVAMAVSDGGNAGSGPASGLSTSLVVPVSVSAVNSAPVVTVPNATIRAAAGHSLRMIRAVSAARH